MLQEWLARVERYIGGDSCGSRGSEYDIRKDRKVFVRGEMAFGVSGSFRLIDILKYRLDIPDHPYNMSVDEYMCTKFIDAVRDAMKDGGNMKIKDGVENFDGYTYFLVGYRKRLFWVDIDLQVGHIKQGAIGTGGEFARGALVAMDRICGDDMPVTDKILEALKVSEKCCVHVKPPYHIVCV